LHALTCFTRKPADGLYTVQEINDFLAKVMANEACLGSFFQQETTNFVPYKLGKSFNLILDFFELNQIPLS